MSQATTTIKFVPPPAQRRRWVIGLVLVGVFVLVVAEVWLGTTQGMAREWQCTPQSLHDTVFAEGELVGVCLPLSPVQLWATRPPHAVLAQIKTTACELLQRRSHISPWFNCASMHKYVSAVVVALFTTYVDVARATLKAPPPPSVYAGGPRGYTTGQLLHESCLRRDGTQNCLQCRAWWLDVSTIDIRLNEAEALALVDPFLQAFGTAEERAEAIHMAFANVSFFDYHTFTPSRASAVHSGQALFHAPLCRPQMYCEATARGLAWLTQVSAVDEHARSDDKFYLSRLEGTGIGSGLHRTMHRFVIAAGTGYKFVQHPNTPYSWTMPSDCPSQLLSCYFDLPTDPLRPWIMEQFKNHKPGLPFNDKMCVLPPERTMFDVKKPRQDLLLVHYTNGRRVERKVIRDPFEAWTEEERSRVRSFIVDEGHLTEAGDAIWGSAFLRSRFFQAFSIRYLINRLKPHINAVVEHEIGRYRLPHPIASMHVRHGDKGREMPLQSLSDHIAYVGPILYAFGIRNIFLSTEDPVVTRQAVSAFGNFHWIFTDDKRSNPSMKDFMRGNRTHEFCLGIRNLFLAAECDVFVGTLRSNWNCLINELQRTNGLGGSYYIDVHGRKENSTTYVGW